ncbi:transglutaminase family protein [Phormidium sp. LEGE 05292]|uniref:transglutaminase-like domain-containing protein n=1 Tax=[Phormidium] sp. LEGE 05292 TaxID=767427 RepID=UPI00187FF566|nr:transglutaminase family protein [Phormidium sp. LEGE 05292]MBE9227105.1 transglutaminase family protein [Phormidium sp. LEGE 05292]
MKYKVNSQLVYTINQPSTFIFNVQVVRNDFQKIIAEELQLDPQLPFDELTVDENGNRYIRLVAPVGNLAVNYQATVDLSHFLTDGKTIAEVAPAELPMETFKYLYPSRYCQSDMLFGLVQSEFNNLQPGYSRVAAICEWIYEKVTYLSGSSDSQTSAYETAMQRAGVCRDFAHLGVAFCRALNIPARFVSVYAYQLEPQDFHAVFEAYLGDRWYLFDATKLAPEDGFIRVGTGRDAADVSVATIFGSVKLEEMKIFVDQVSEEKEPDNMGEAIAFA